MSLLEELTALPEADPVEPRRLQHPRGWEPGVKYELDGRRVITTPPTRHIEATDAAAEGLYAELLEAMGQAVPDGMYVRLAEAKYDPLAWTRDTDGADALTQPCWRYKFVVEPDLRAANPSEHLVDMDAMIKSIMRHKAPVRPKTSTADAEAFAVVIGDWQLGKADGDGTGGIIDRILAAIDAVEVRVKELRRVGRNLTDLYVFGVGDIIESCEGHYAMQAFQTQLTLTEQIRAARVLITKALQRWSRLFDRVVVAVVQGNHGEVRSRGKAYTSFGDNFDTDVFKSAAEVLEANPEAYGHVSFAFPQGEEITLTLDVLGARVGLAHGHQFNLKGVERWLAKQALGRQPIGDVDILLTGHYHHFLCQPLGAVTHMQCPTLDGGSDWFRHGSGTQSVPGMLTFALSGAGWRDLAIL